jgi:prepilin-type N-terminal cleavage/methylation domain-containing protein
VAAHPRHSRPVGRTLARGFSLVEILLVLALLVLFATLLLPGVNSMLREIEAQAPEQRITGLMLDARQQALETGRTIELRYEAETRRFRIGPTWSEPLPAGLQLELLPVWDSAMVLLGGELVATGEMRRVRFFPDGTCDPFRVQLREQPAPPRLLVADPWTCTLSPQPGESR